MGVARVRSFVPPTVRRRVGPPVRAWRARGELPRARLATAPLRVLPDFLVIGAAKAGTSSVFYALKHHPTVHPPITKELGYFDLHYAYGDGWYRAHFPTFGDRRRAIRAGHGFATFEATPYYLFHPHAARRAAATVPTAKVVALLRNPVDRAYSHYQHHRRDGKERLTFEEAIEREGERIDAELHRTVADEWYRSDALQTFSYLARGRYAEQLEVWFRHFPREQVLVVRSEDLYDEPGEVFERMLDFLGLPAWAPDQYVRRNEGGYREDMAEGVRRRLSEHFAPHNERLYELLGTDMQWE